MVEIINNYFTPTSVLDIGTNLGQFYNECKQFFPKAYYYLVEPNPQCLFFLQESNCDYFSGAFSNIEGTKPFYISKAQHACTGNSFYREQTTFFSDENIEIIDVPTKKLDSFFINEKKIYRFDLIKIDTQGSELDILLGGESMIKNALGIIMEVAVVEYNKNAPLANLVIDYIEKLGFEKKERVGSNNNPTTHELVHEDYFFINKNLL